MELYSYTEEELNQLHVSLHEILAEIIRVCKENDISYFIIGGTAIGAYFWEDIIPWDDDIDLGMTRDNYEKFLQIAPKALKKEFFLQWYGTDPKSPFFFTKVRKNNTTFKEYLFRNIDMHHGIYVDIFPFDKIPNNNRLANIQRALVSFFNGCFISKSIWQYSYIKKCEIDEPRKKGFLPCLITYLFTLLPKSSIYKLLCWSQKLFHGSKEAKYYNMLTLACDMAPVEDLDNVEEWKLGPNMVSAPANLFGYLNCHYPGVKKYIPKEMQINHRPDILSFTEGDVKLNQ